VVRNWDCRSLYDRKIIEGDVRLTPSLTSMAVRCSSTKSPSISA